MIGRLTVSLQIAVYGVHLWLDALQFLLFGKISSAREGYTMIHHMVTDERCIRSGFIRALFVIIKHGAQQFPFSVDLL